MSATALALVALLLSTAGGVTAETTQQRLERATQERAALEQRLAETAVALEDLAVATEEHEAALVTLESDVVVLEQAAVQAEAALEELARDTFQRGPDPEHVLLQVLDAEGPQDVLERARVLGSLSRSDREAIEVGLAARATLTTRRAELEAGRAQLADEQVRTAELRAGLEADFAQARTSEAELATRAERQRRLDRPGQSGIYACPLQLPYTFRDTWGAPRSGGRRHKGVDMFAPYGAPVFAITAGEISRLSNGGLGGLSVYLRGDDGNEYYYAHLAAIEEGYGPGRRVEAGELVASNGDSGNARGGAPHVHFQVAPGGGGPVNPYPYTAAACF